MEVIRGRTLFEMDENVFQERRSAYRQTLLDLGTGDGRYVRSMAEKAADIFYIGVDACRENLRAVSRKALPNTLFVIAGAQALPLELAGSISHITINFPWGSLMQSLLGGDSGLMNGLASISRTRTGLEIRLNSGALAEAGYALEQGADQICCSLLQAGWQEEGSEMMDTRALRELPSIWAKRLAFGRDPRAIQLNLRRVEG